MADTVAEPGWRGESDDKDERQGGDTTRSSPRIALPRRARFCQCPATMA